LCYNCGPCLVALSGGDTPCCITSCPDSKVVIQPPPVCITIPGAVLTSYPNECIISSSTNFQVLSQFKMSVFLISAEVVGGLFSHGQECLVLASQLHLGGYFPVIPPCYLLSCWWA
uniref:Keratin n=1 Tax=Pseudonaja textilis TaxID=8673 RepID=A0A670Z316_PSETE